MTDIRHVWSPDALAGDWLVSGGALDDQSDLETAVILSLFTDRRADPDDRLPDGTRNLRGWWGDDDAERGALGSRLWLLVREKATERTRERAEEYAREALAWMLEDQVADAIEISAIYQPGVPANLILSVEIRRDGQQLLSRRFDRFWQELQQ